MTELTLHVAQVGVRYGVVVVVVATTVAKLAQLLVGEQWSRWRERMLLLRAAAQRTIEWQLFQLSAQQNLYLSSDAFIALGKYLRTVAS